MDNLMVQVLRFLRARAKFTCAVGSILIIGVCILARRFPMSPLPRRNPEKTQRDVEFVGADTCANCHAHEAETFRQSPMGRSASLASQSIAAQSAGEHRVANLGIPFEYKVTSQEEIVHVTETMIDGSGAPAYSQ